MDEFIQKIVDCVTTDSKRLSIVKNPDGFLLRADTQQKVLAGSGLLLLPINNSLELRVRYELEDRHSCRKVCYIMDDVTSVLPDIMKLLYVAPVFNVSKLLPACHEMELLQSKISFNSAAYIYRKRILANLSQSETKDLLEEVENIYGFDSQTIVSELKQIQLDWTNVETMEQICSCLLKCINKGAYNEIAEAIEEINKDFQKFLDNRYFTFINSSSISKPKMVHKVLPHLKHKHLKGDKVALLVVDGMTYWQYLILDEALRDIDITTKKDITLAWLPSITKLSRQAIFRGEIPLHDYIQSPQNESRLWMDYWTSTQLAPAKRLLDYEVNYTYASFALENDTFNRIAMVDVNLDEKLHSLDNNKDLLSLTKNWAEEIAEDISTIHKQGYTIYITTDHGNVLANPWRKLTPQEKTFLYEKESRGKRHLIYNQTEYLDNFLSENTAIKNDLFVHDNWAIWRNTQSFESKDLITHGGAHFLEVVIPFIKIEK
jgi:hypothetical protein